MGGLVLVLGYAVFLPVPVIPIMMVYICLVQLWIIFLSVVETLVIVSSGLSGVILKISSGLINFVMKLIHFTRLQGFGQ